MAVPFNRPLRGLFVFGPTLPRAAARGYRPNAPIRGLRRRSPHGVHQRPGPTLSAEATSHRLCARMLSQIPEATASRVAEEVSVANHSSEEEAKSARVPSSLQESSYESSSQIGRLNRSLATALSDFNLGKRQAQSKGMPLPHPSAYLFPEFLYLAQRELIALVEHPLTERLRAQKT